ncbi:MAG: hypothetical protein AAFR21_06465 [Pseudomonadota bacterium]
MEDLMYILELGFSGSDLSRAIILAFFIAIMFSHNRSIWTLGAGGLLIDRIMWPLVEQSLSGAEPGTVMESFTSIIGALGDDLGVYVIRYLGIVIMIGLFREARVRLHHMMPAKKAAA